MLIAFYLAARMFMGAYYCLLAGIVPMVRGTMIAQAFLTLIPASLWIASIHVETPQRYALIWVAIFIDLCGSIVIVLLIRTGDIISHRLGEWAGKVFEFYPAINIEHKTERTNAFVGLVFGYSVVAIIYQNAAHYGLNAFYGKAALGLVQAFCFNWIYFELDGADLYTHAIRRNVASGIIPLLPQIPIQTETNISFSDAMERSTPPLHHGIRARSWRTFKACTRHRLPRHKYGRLD